VTLPLTGFRVVELGSWVAVPAAAAMLADWGATVVKAEAPTGDPLRSLHDTGFAAVEPPVNAVFQGENHSKHSMRFDLTRTDDRARLVRLVGEADVFLTNLRSASLAKFELTYPALAAAHPRLVYAQLTGYGRDGPDSDRAGYDYAAFWGRSGLLASMAEDGRRPPSPRPGVGDHVAALALCSGILAALLHRERTGLGQEVHVSLLATGLWANAMDVHLQQAGADGPGRPRRPNPLFALYRTADDRWLHLMLGQPERDWGRLCAALGLDPADARFRDQDRRVEHADELAELLETTFAREPLRTWADRLDRAGVAWGPCETIAGALRDPQVLASCPPRLVRTTPPVPVVGHPVSLHGPASPAAGGAAGAADAPMVPPAPDLGEHDGRSWVELEPSRTTAGTAAERSSR
jgi:crotonobetainyl-CoA:carnitine CoA-transferase CaiB-like acyl-CoA transferase